MHPNAATVTDLALALLSPDRAVREEAERTLLADPANTERALVRALGESSDAPPGVIARLALVLGAMRARAGLNPLLGRLDGADDATRAAIARALSELLDGRDAFDSAVTRGLESLANDQDRTVRGYAAQAFARLGDERSLARVRALSEDPDPFVRQRAERMLTQSDAAFSSPDLAGATPADARRVLGPWLDDLGDRRRAVSEAAIVRLVGAGAVAVDLLIERLHQPYPRVRVAAAKALGQLRAPKASGPLLIAATAPAVTPEDQPLAAVALRALVNCLTGSETGIADALIGLAKNAPDRLARANALLCLGRVADREGLRHVVAALSDQDALIVESATIALSEGVREEDTDLVLPLLDAYDGRPRQGLTALRESILIALSRIEIGAPSLKVRVRHRVRHEVEGPTASLRRLAIALAASLYREDDPPVLPLVEAVMQRLNDPHAEVRAAAASFLAQHIPAGLPQGASRLTLALKRHEPSLYAPLLAALARLRTSQARNTLLAASQNDAPELASAAAEYVERMDPLVQEWEITASPAPTRRTYTPRAGSESRASAKPGGSSASPEAGGSQAAPRTGQKRSRADRTGEGEAVDAVFSTEEGPPLEPAMSLPEGEMPAPGPLDETDTIFHSDNEAS